MLCMSYNLYCVFNVLFEFEFSSSCIFCSFFSFIYMYIFSWYFLWFSVYFFNKLNLKSIFFLFFFFLLLTFLYFILSFFFCFFCFLGYRDQLKTILFQGPSARSTIFLFGTDKMHCVKGHI